MLHVGDVLQKLCVQSRQVEIAGRYFGRDMRITQPSQTLIALIIVGRDSVEIRANGPLNRALQPLEQIVRRRKRASGIDHGMNHPCFNLLHRRTTDLHISEPVISERGLPKFASSTAQNIGIFGLRVPKRTSVDAPIRQQRFGITQPHRRSGRARNLHLRPTANQLSKIVNTGLECERSDGRDHFNGCDHLRRHSFWPHAGQRGGPPVSIYGAGIINFAIVQAVR